MSDFDLDEVKLKTPDEMSDEEKDFLRENKEELTDGDKEDYKDILEDKKEPEKEEESGDKKDVEEGDKEEEKEEAKHSFKTDEDLEAYYKERQTREKDEAKKAKEDAKIDRGELFPKGYKPADWNEFSKDFLGVIKKDRARADEETRRRIQIATDRLESETEELRALPGIKGIPAPETKARRTFDTKVTNLMLRDAKINSVAKAYKVIQGENFAAKEKKEKKVDLAKKIGGTGGTGEAAKSVKYEKFASRDLDQAAEAALEQFESLS